MTTVVLAVDPVSPGAAAIERAAEVIRSGGLVAFPTETVYGLGADALDPHAVARIFAAKGRPATNPIIVHVADANAARRVSAAWPTEAERLAARFWPGPLTLVLPRCDSVPDAVTGGGPTVGVRSPAHPVAQALIRAAGVPIAAPSANRSSRISPTRAEHVRKALAGRIDLILDGGPSPGGLESTVLDLSRIPPRILRPGLVTPDAIRRIIGEVDIGAGPPESLHLRSPGMLPRHYAPSAPLELADAESSAGGMRVEELARRGAPVGWLPIRGFPDADREVPGAVRIVMPATSADYAACLYCALHALEEAGVERIVAALPPDTEEWLAVRDRLRRASTRD